MPWRHCIPHCLGEHRHSHRSHRRRLPRRCLLYQRYWASLVGGRATDRMVLHPTRPARWCSRPTRRAAWGQRSWSSHPPTGLVARSTHAEAGSGGSSDEGCITTIGRAQRCLVCSGACLPFYYCAFPHMQDAACDAARRPARRALRPALPLWCRPATPSPPKSPHLPHHQPRRRASRARCPSACAPTSAPIAFDRRPCCHRPDAASTLRASSAARHATSVSAALASRPPNEPLPAEPPAEPPTEPPPSRPPSRPPPPPCLPTSRRANLSTRRAVGMVRARAELRICSSRRGTRRKWR